MTSWSDTVLSTLLHTVDDGFREILTNSCYILANSFFHIRDSLGIIFLYSFLQVTL